MQPGRNHVDWGERHPPDRGDESRSGGARHVHGAVRHGFSIRCSRRTLPRGEINAPETADLGTAQWVRPLRLAQTVAPAIMEGMAEQAHVELSGDINGRYVVTDRRDGGELTLVPDTSAEAIRERAGLLDPTPEQAEAFWRENEPHMLPPDDEP